MHTAALLGESEHDAAGYGWQVCGYLPPLLIQSKVSSFLFRTTFQASAKPVHNWATLRENVQDHIKGLNFGYRVELREVRTLQPKTTLPSYSKL